MAHTLSSVGMKQKTGLSTHSLENMSRFLGFAALAGSMQGECLFRVCKNDTLRVQLNLSFYLPALCMEGEVMQMYHCVSGRTTLLLQHSLPACTSQFKGTTLVYCKF